MDASTNKDSILHDFKKNEQLFHSFRDRIKNLLSDLIDVEKFATHQISCRTKSLDSLTKKIENKNNKYQTIYDITDIVGIRIITYLESDVDAIFEIIQSEFIVDIKNSIDKRKLNADQFGYKSLHIVIELSKKRGRLKEFAAYKNLKCEIQIRSILQHAWAEIEHDLGYKSEKGIPERYKRTFNRLSALLETADIEFDRLKSELKDYDIELPELIIKEPGKVDLNKISLEYVFYNNPILQKATTIIENKVSGFSKTRVDWDLLISNLHRLEIVTVNDITTLLKSNQAKFLKYVELSYNDKDVNVSEQIALFAFIRFVVIIREGLNGYEAYFDFNEWSRDYLETNQEIEIFKKLGIKIS